MSHVDEGTLHALVDNALDADERRSVEAHLASCGDCARRFAEATAMARQVNTLLGALDDVGGKVQFAKPAGRVVAPAVTGAVPGVTPIRRRFSTLKRVAIAASVMLVAGVSFQIGTRPDRRENAALAIPVMASPKAAPMVAPPSVVDAPAADSYAVAPTAAPRQRVRTGARIESEVATADRADDVSKKAAAEEPAAQRAQQDASMKPLPMVARETVADSSEERRNVARASSDALGRVQAPAQERAQQNAPASPVPARSRRDESRPEPSLAAGAAAPSAASALAANAGLAKRAMPKAGTLPGYTATDEQSLPSVMRRTYVSSSGTALLLLITQPLADAKAQGGAGARPSEFVVTTDSGRSIVRWHARGFDYELQALLAPDSLVKLATQIK